MMGVFDGIERHWAEAIVKKDIARMDAELQQQAEQALERLKAACERVRECQRRNDWLGEQKEWEVVDWEFEVLKSTRR